MSPLLSEGSATAHQPHRRVTGQEQRTSTGEQQSAWKEILEVKLCKFGWLNKGKLQRKVKIKDGRGGSKKKLMLLCQH